MKLGQTWWLGIDVRGKRKEKFIVFTTALGWSLPQETGGFQPSLLVAISTAGSREGRLSGGK